MNIEKEFMLGCNYWASNAGAEMWREFDADVIREDLAILVRHGVRYLRVFPNWRDFQPVEPLLKIRAEVAEYRLIGDRLPENPYYLDEVMLGRFALFCDICQEMGIKLIVGLITGWMSGRTFVPPALYGKNLFTDPTALYFEQLLVTGIVERFREHPAIYAWDHGNECQCMSEAGDHITAAGWSRMISNTVYATDKTRPLLSGHHSLSTDGTWRIDEQASVCDMLVTHPYPFWGRHTANDTNTYIKTGLYAAAQTQLYTDLGKRPCLVEEVGTMGPSVCSEELAADVLRMLYFSTLSCGGRGLLWWCACEQMELMTPPYTWTTVENELGMLYSDRTPKPVLREMKRLSELKLDLDLPEAKTDAVCLLSEGQDTWGVAYMTFVLAKQAGMNIRFADAAKEIPDASVYMLPSVKGSNIMPKELYLKLRQRIADGAKLYVSQGGGILAEFEALTGNRILDSETVNGGGTLTLNGKNIPYTVNRRLYIENIRAERVQSPLITKASYGRGQVWYVNFPVEAMLIGKNRAFENNAAEIYREIFREEIEAHPIRQRDGHVALTIHEDGDRVYAIAVNHGDRATRIELETELKTVRVHYGDRENCRPMDALVVEFSR